MTYLILLVIFFAAMFVYFKIADRYNIIDKPNERSSHSAITVRGGGIIFLVAALAVIVLHPQLWMLVVAYFIIGIISFIDDRMVLSNKIRIIFHLVAVSILFYYATVFKTFAGWSIPLLYIIVIGSINAYNFMDGINGITGVYSLAILAGLQYINLKYPFTEPDLIWLPMLACVVFLFFNFRIRAACFAGDVGSVTMALWVISLILLLIVHTNNYSYILFLALYGVDSVLTIIHRLLLRQNIFKAHRFHFYQVLANEQKISHLLISTCYGLLQLLIILIVIFSGLNFFQLALLIICPLILVYVTLKPRLMVVNLKKK